MNHTAIKPVLGIDLDDTVFHYVKEIRDRLIRDGITPPTKLPNDYSFAKSGWFPTDEDFRVYHGKQVEDGIYANLKPINGAVETLWELHDAGFEINIITSRFVRPRQHAAVVEQTVESLEKWDIPYDNISFLRNKTIQHADMYVDDAPHNIQALTALGRNVVIFNAAHNQQEQGLRAYNWEDARRHIKDTLGQ